MKKFFKISAGTLTCVLMSSLAFIVAFGANSTWHSLAPPSPPPAAISKKYFEHNIIGLRHPKSEAVNLLHATCHNGRNRQMWGSDIASQLTHSVNPNFVYKDILNNMLLMESPLTRNFFYHLPPPRAPLAIRYSWYFSLFLTQVSQRITVLI